MSKIRINPFGAQLLGTFFYVGYFPFAPGSAASLLGLGLVLLLRGNPLLYVLVALAVLFLGFVTASRLEAAVGKKDPSCVVIDEVAGSFLAFFMLPPQPSVIITAFFLFRAFDMFKIYPMDKLEALPGGAGVMMDDIVAGIYTNVVMQIALRWVGV